MKSKKRGDYKKDEFSPKYADDFLNVYEESLSAEAQGHYNPLTQEEIDEFGLDSNDRRMLSAIVKFYRGGPVGLETLAAAIGEEAVTIEDVIEPYLMQIGFLNRTPRGRCITRAACLHMGFDMPDAQEGQIKFE